MSIAQAKVLDIDWDYTMAWFPATLLKTPRAYRLVRRRCAYSSFRSVDIMQCSILEMRHGLPTLNSNNFVVYGQKHKRCVLVFFVRMSGTLSNLGETFCFDCIVYSNSIQGTLLNMSSNGLGNKTVISCLFVV